MGIINVSPSDIRVTNDNMLVVSGMPTFRIVGNYLEFTDKNKMRCAARGGDKVRVRIADLVGAMNKKS